MEISILEMALETLKNKVEALNEEVIELREEIAKRPQEQITQYNGNHQNPENTELDEFLTSKEVEKILGVCYNTLQNTIVRKGLLIPKRVGARRIRYSKRELVSYMNKVNDIN